MTQDERNDALTEPEQQSACPKWTVMIYLAGDNNLSANSIAIMQQLEAAVPPGAHVRVLACFDSNTPRPRGARYVEINYRRHLKPDPHKPPPPPKPKWNLHNDLVPFEELKSHPVTTPDFCNPNPASVPPMTEPMAKEGLSRFLQFALRNHKADRYMLILFGHGSAVAGNTFLMDNNPPSFLRLKDFAEVLARHFDKIRGTSKPKLDVLACDNCMMNGIETAYQIKDQVDYVLGSQGLMLAVGWPFREIIESIVCHRNDSTECVALGVLKACAGSLIDFSLMDRSSEQSLCDLTTLDRDRNTVTAVKKLVAAMQEGLEFDKCGRLLHPEIRDAIRLARLEAQSFWSETFVDLYDFCMLLLDRCNDALRQQVKLFEELQINLFRAQLSTHVSKTPTGREGNDENNDEPIEAKATPIEIKEFLLRAERMKLFEEITRRCRDVMNQIKVLEEDKDDKKDKGFVTASYYVGPELQYSNGVSIYFPWTLPEGPIIFEPVGGGRGEGAGGSYGLSWSSFDRVKKPPEDYILKTSFDEYKDYDFAKCGGGDWAAFLERFFKATLRNVRRFEFEYKKNAEKIEFFEQIPIEHVPFIPPAGVDLQKSSSDTDSEDDCTCPTIKNYPRRFYVSPEDCLRRSDHDKREDAPKECEDMEPTASYLGWNIRGLLAEVLEMPPQPQPLLDSEVSDASDSDSETVPERAPDES